MLRTDSPLFYGKALYSQFLLHFMATVVWRHSFTTPITPLDKTLLRYSCDLTSLQTTLVCQVNR